MARTGNPTIPLELPPPFQLRWVAGDAFTAACAAAAAGGVPGTLVVARGTLCCDMAVLLAPDRPAAQCWAALPVAMLAAADALAAIGPPLKAVTFAWPDVFVIDGGEVGRARVALGATPTPAAVPDWGVVGIELQVRSAAGTDEPGSTPGRTVLHEEGFGAATVPAIVEGFARHFLLWTHRWLEDGLALAIAHYQSRLARPDPKAVRFEPASFDLVHLGPPPRREALARSLARRAP